jgi:trans-aconitate 2-methyltransferase
LRRDCFVFVFLCAASHFFGNPFLVFSVDRWHPEEYVQYVRTYEAWALQRLNAYRFSGNENILDFECKDGRITATMASRVPFGSAVGIDTSPSMIAYASAKYRDRKNLQFQLNDEHYLECDHNFDLITSFFSIQWIRDIASKIKQFQKYLTPGGMLWIVTSHKMPVNIASAMKKSLSRSKWSPYFEGYKLPISFYSAEDYRRFLSEAHLQLLDMQIFKGRELFASRENFRAYLEQLLPLLDVLPIELKKEFLDEFIDFYLELSPPDRYGRIFVDRDIIEVKARNIPDKRAPLSGQLGLGFNLSRPRLKQAICPAGAENIFSCGKELFN